MRATIATHISVDPREIPVGLYNAIRAALTIPNPEKDRAISEHIRGAKDLPDELWLWSERNGRIIIPRGFAHSLQGFAQDHHTVIDWDVQMALDSLGACFRDWKPAELREYQVKARDGLLHWGSGIMMAPTASGKTRCALEAARHAGQKTLVIVDKTSLAQQWMTATFDTYGYEAGLIGDGTWIERDFTIALRQSLWSRREIISDHFWKSWGMVILDEVHHASAETLNDLIQRFPAYYRLGYSATPEWDESLFPYIEAVVGPIVHRTRAVDIGEVLVKPSVVVVPTAFEFAYQPTRMEGRRRIQNNYTEMMAELCADSARNLLIVNLALEEALHGHHVLITSRRVEHVEQLVRLLAGSAGVTIHILTGKQSKIYERTRQEIATSTTGTILISTIADEALDIPRLDRLIMAYPARRVPLVEQQIGRLTRPAEGKTDAIVYDIYDERVGVLKGQHRDRSQQLYLRRRWAIERRESVAA